MLNESQFNKMLKSVLAIMLIWQSGLNAKKIKDTQEKTSNSDITALSKAQNKKIYETLKRTIDGKQGPYYFELMALGHEQWWSMRRALTTPQEFTRLFLRQRDFMTYDENTNKWTYKKMYIHYPDFEHSDQELYTPKTEELDKLSALLTDPAKYDKIRSAFALFAKAQKRDKQLLHFRTLVKTTLNNHIFDTTQSVEKCLDLRLMRESFVVLDAMARLEKNPDKLTKEQMRKLVYSAGQYVMKNPEFVSRTSMDLLSLLYASRVPCEPSASTKEKYNSISDKTNEVCCTIYGILHNTKYKDKLIESEIRKYQRQLRKKEASKNPPEVKILPTPHEKNVIPEKTHINSD